MSILALGTGGVITEKTILTDNTATTVLDTGKATLIESIIVQEVGGDTPNLTIEAYDGTTSTYRLFESAMTAKQRYEDLVSFQLANDEVLRVTVSNASGEAHVWVNYFNPDATQRQA